MLKSCHNQNGGTNQVDLSENFRERLVGEKSCLT